jgi:hypothetical protein
MMEELDSADFKIRSAIEDLIVARPEMTIEAVSL